MIQLKDRKILDDGTVICNEHAAIYMLYNDQDLTDIILDDTELARQFNGASKLLDSNFEFLNSGIEPVYNDIDWYNIWLTPDYYKNIDIKQYCLSKCNTSEQADRVNYEFKLFEEREMVPVLKNLLWLVDHFKKNNILYGVGRGSSISSYILYLIGISRIDPLKYDLDINEFLR